MRCYWEHPWGTHWELREHRLEHDWNTRIKKFHPHASPPAHSPKGEKMNPLGCMFSRLIGCMHILFPHIVATIFVPQLIPLLQSTLLQSTLYLFWGYLFCSILISWGCLTSPTFFLFAMSQFDWPMAKKKMELWRLPIIEDSTERWSASPFGPTI